MNRSEPANAGAPVACGALGSFDPVRVARIASELDGELTEVHRDPTSVLLLDRAPVAWQGSRQRGLAWSERVATNAAKAGDWSEAAASGALGLVLEGDRRLVHASASGFGPLFWVRDGAALYFATAVEPLVRTVTRPLSVDWASVAALIAIGYPPGDGTLFSEIKRLDPLGRLEARPGSAPAAFGGDLVWADVEPDGSVDAAEAVVAALRAEVELLDSNQPVLCPLSGGWDSRLLLCLLAERELDLQAWTIDMDTGHEVESEMSAPVAAGLGVPHTIIRMPRREYADDFSESARRSEYLATVRYSVFFNRLARTLPAGVVVEGSGAGFLKGNFNVPVLGEGSDWSRGAADLLDHYAPAEAGHSVLEPEAWAKVRGAARAAFVPEVNRFAEHPAGTTLGVYWTRIRRRTAPTPAGIFGVRHSVGMPFLNDAAIRASLLCPPEAKVNGGLYERIFDRVNPAMWTLASSNDGVARASRSRRRPTSSPSARRFYTSVLKRSPLLGWLNPDLRQAVERERLGKRAKNPWFLERVQLVCVLTLWYERYADRLDGFDPAELLGSRPAQPSRTAEMSDQSV